MNPPSPANCPRCQVALPSDSPQGLCPRCLAAMNFATETAFTDDETPAPTEAPLSPAELAPHFPQLEILECLGRGGMGVVYRARQKSLDRFVALKILAPERVRDPRFADRFAREAQALARLNHPSIVTIHDFGVAGGFFFLLMEYVDGVNLRQLLRTRRLSPEEALAIVPPLCEALQYAHVRGIVHRDIKPENLLLDREGRVKIADFGIARMLGTEDATIGLAETQPAGTPGYMAPEQRSAPTTVDSRADIYSLGVVLYEMLTGEAPGTPFQPPSRRVHIDVRLDEIVLRALEQSPELRFQTAAEFRSEVESAVASRHSPPGPTPAAGQFSSPRWVGAALGLVSTFTLLILGLTVLAMTHGRFSRNTDFAMSCLAVAGGIGVGVWSSKYLGGDAGRRLGARWPRYTAILALLLWLPVLGFGIAFGIEFVRSTDGWHPGLGESVIVPLSWCGMFALPWAGRVLWDAGRPGTKARRRGFWRGIAVGTFAAVLLPGIVAWSLLRAAQAKQNAEMARHQAMIAEQRAQAAEEFGANVTAIPLRGRLVDRDGAPVPDRQIWIVSPSYQPDRRNVPILKQLMTDAQGRFETEVLNGRSWQVMRPDFPKQIGPRSRAITVRSTGDAASGGIDIEVRAEGDEVRVEVLRRPVE